MSFGTILIKCDISPHRKYRYMEVNLQQKRKGLEVKIPDISKTLDVVRFLEARRVSIPS